MKTPFAEAMRQATNSVRAGDTASAMQTIQAALSAQPPSDAPSAGSNSLPQGLADPAKILGSRQPLSKTLTLLKSVFPKNAAKLNGGLRAPTQMPPLPDGARFDVATYSCAAGQRDYRLYVPKSAAEQPTGLIMMLHGCTQTPEDFAVGTGMNSIADQQGLIIVYPAQSRSANMQSCWNWFGPNDQMRDRGEPAILAGLAQDLAKNHNVRAQAVFVAGLSAGAAMAVILGRTYPDVFMAVGAHSGLPFKSASDVPSAFTAMRGVPNQPTGAAPSIDTSTRTIVIHGTADATVNLSNGHRIATEARVSDNASETELVDTGHVKGRGFKRTSVVSHTGRSNLELWEVTGLGHAWSGGSTAGSYADPQGPDASAEMVRFFLQPSVGDL